MTREELRDYVDQQRSLDSIPYPVYSMLIDGIDTLEQEPCEDAISRADVLDLCDSKDPDYKVYHFKEDVECLPPVYPNPKIGHWIVQPSNEEQGERPFIWWKCSNCGQVIFSETTHDRLEFHAFCGRCGARMVEPQTESEG